MVEIKCSDPNMEPILRELLETDVTITAREVARRHPGLNHASSITRDNSRMQILTAYKQEQNSRRDWLIRSRKRSLASLVAKIADQEQLISDLRHRVELLQISHVAVIRAVGEMGGMSKLLKLYESYSGVRTN